jgi:RsiW-degrading membrane proteinase PrsW (M82 family)
MSGKQAILAIIAILVGSGLGYFWNVNRPQDPIEIVVGVSLLAILLVFFSLQSMGKH